MTKPGDSQTKKTMYKPLPESLTMGGFINHSDDANTVKVELKINGEDDPLLKVATKKWNLVALRNIKEGEELTVKYTFYDI